jgi:hypothetical protein
MWLKQRLGCLDSQKGRNETEKVYTRLFLQREIHVGLAFALFWMGWVIGWRSLRFIHPNPELTKLARSLGWSSRGRSHGWSLPGWGVGLGSGAISHDWIRLSQGPKLDRATNEHY